MPEASIPLDPVFDTDLSGWLIFNNIQPSHATLEDNRVALWFPADSVRQAKQQIAAGQARPDIRVWSSIIRTLHVTYFSPSAKAALRSRSGLAHRNEQ